MLCRVSRLWWALFMSLVIASTATAQDLLEVNPGAPTEYRVQSGDTLWDIADMYLSEPWRWQELWAGNPHIDNPDLIYPGDVLSLRVPKGGKPQLRISRGGEIKLKPGMRVTPLDLAIPLIGLDEIGAFLRRNRVLDKEQAENSPYILASNKQNLLSAPGDVVVARGAIHASTQSKQDTMYGVYRVGQQFKDPVTGEALGLEARLIGSAQKLESSSNSSDLTEFEVKTVKEEIRQGDRLLPLRERILDAAYQPRAPEFEVSDGYMIAVEGGVNQIGSLNTVILNKGARDGLEVGHMLHIYQTGARVRDELEGDMVRLPDVRAGLLMVFEVFDKSSLAVVLKASRPLSVMDKVKTP